VAAYLKAVHVLLQAEDKDLSPDNPVFRQIIAVSPTVLVSSLDKVVRQYQLEGEQAIRRMLTVETAVWLMTLLLLALEAKFIFHPFTLRMRLTIASLQSATDSLFESKERLRNYQDQLERQVELRTLDLARKTKELSESEEKFRLISSSANEGIIIIGPDGRISYWNPAASKVFGYEESEVLARDMHELLAPARNREDAQRGFAQFCESGQGPLLGKTVEVAGLRKSGEEFPVELSLSRLLLNGQWHALGVVRDISERRQAEEQIRQLAYYDTLTELPNRRLLLDRLEHALTQAKRHQYALALMFLDLDRFKQINDDLGHDVGDELLKAVAKRLSECVRSGDTVSRQGGDEFVVVLERIEQAEDASQVAEKILSIIKEPLAIDGHVLDITVSLGIAIFQPDGEAGIQDLMKQADTAMYAAKQAGRNCYRYFEPPGAGATPV
jgi:diguanylate cyclase (GGDEF)-like protein/PAS domain S-box-containing protein